MDDPPIDFCALEKELDNTIQEDVRYWQQNDAKFRAVEQKVATYEEFSQIVKGAHLKPLEKRDKVENLSSKFSIWNTVAAMKTDKLPCQLSNLQMEKKEEKLPRTTGEFLKQWKSLSTVDRLNLLKQFEHQHFTRIFNVDIPVNVLSEVFQVLLSLQFSMLDVLFVITVLEEMSKSRRFNLNIQFLSSIEKDTGRELFEKLFEHCQQDASGKETIKEKILELKKKYQM